MDYYSDTNFNSHLVFLSSSDNDKDKQWVQRFKRALTPLMRTQPLKIWDATLTPLGANRNQTITSIKDAEIAVLFVSQDFISSEVIYKEQIIPIVEAAKQKKIILKYLIVSDCLYEETPLSAFKPVNEDVYLGAIGLYRQEELLANLARDIKNELQNLEASTTTPIPTNPVEPTYIDNNVEVGQQFSYHKKSKFEFLKGIIALLLIWAFLSLFFFFLGNSANIQLPPNVTTPTIPAKTATFSPVEFSKPEDPNGIVSIAWSPDSTVLAAGSGDKNLRLWRVDGTVIPVLGQQHTDRISKVVWSPDGTILATSARNDSVRLWRKDGTLITTIPITSGWVQTLAWSRDSKMLATGSIDNTVGLWSADGKLIKTLRHDNWVLSLAWLDGKLLTSGSLDNTVRIWREDGTPVGNPLVHGDLISALAWSPDGKTLAAASWDGTISLSTVDGKPISVLRGHTGRVNTVAWSLDSKTLASASQDKTIRLWSTNGKELARMSEHTSDVYVLAWSYKNNIIASGSWDYTIRLWGTNGTPIRNLIGHTNRVSAVAWSPDDKILASGSEDNTVRLWTADGSAIVTLSSK